MRPFMTGNRGDVGEARKGSAGSGGHKLIEAQGLSKHYGDVKALQNLSIDVPPGEIFCFLGPNGAGKTTTIKLMTGLLRPTAGRALIDGIDIHKDPVEAKKRIGYVPDMPYMYDRLSCAEFFRFTGELYGVANDAIREDLESSFSLFGLQEYRQTLVRDLSHGLRQRLIYAATFLHKPSVLFVDEPLVGLDPYTIRLLKDMLTAKAASGMTIFLTTHILALAQDVGHRIGIIMHGRLVALGTLEDLLANSSADTLEDVFLQITETPGQRKQ